MKFVADAMLGRLARWLRFLGIDIAYVAGIEDNKLLRLSREQGRIILTRDSGLLRRKGHRDIIFIESDEVARQLLQIKDALNLREGAQPIRCVACNGELAEVSRKDGVRERVPDFVFHSVERFMRCTECRKIYWQGSHHERFNRKVRSILGQGDQD